MRPDMMLPHRRRTPLAVSLLAVIMALAACSIGGGTNGTAGGATPTTLTGCAAVPGFEHATTPPSGGSHFADVGYPPGATGATSAAPEANGFQYQLVRVCTPSSAPAAVYTFYGGDLASRGWTTTATFPATGDLGAACAHTPDCYIKNDGVIRFLAVEDVAASGGLTTYTLRLVIEPYASGGGLFAAGEREDFDPTGPGGGTDDVTWTGSQLTPVGAAKLAGVGLRGSLNTLSYADVIALPFAATPVAGSALAPGYVFAVATTDGRFVKVRVVTHAGTELQLEFVTYPYTF